MAQLLHNSYGKPGVVATAMVYSLSICSIEHAATDFSYQILT